MPKQKIESSFDEYKESKEDKKIEYTQEEKEYRGFLIERLLSAHGQRESDHIEFDDNTYTQQFIENNKAANGYNPPRKNEEDTRIVTGTTQEKEGTLLSALLNFNFEANITAHDKNDNEVVGLGEDVEDMVNKSRKMEKYRSKRRVLYKEFLDQGTVFVEEVKKEQVVFDKTIKGSDWLMGGVNTKEIKWDTKIKKLYAECETNILSGTSVYLGNIREFFIEKQPFIFIRDEIPYSEARMIYGDWDRFEYVPKTVVSIDPATSEYVDYRDFSIVETSENMVEVIKYQDPHNNEFMITLNGVMMLPIKFPLTAVSPSGMYTVAKGDAEVISKFFAYSKSIPAKTKVDQEVLDEITKMVLLKMKKSFMPPVANNTGRVLSRKIFLPGKIVDGVNPNSIQEIGTNTGPTAAEFNTFQLIKQMANEKSIDPVFAGESGGEQTASEAIQRKQQQMMKLGQTVVGIIELERRLVELRIHNILANWTLPVDTKVDKVRKELVNLYRTVQVETTFQDNGKKGTKIINFDPKASEYFGTEEGTEELRDLEDKIKESTGKETRFTFLNADVVRNFDGFWYVDITPTEEQSSQLDRVLFMENLTQAIEIFGMQSMNMEYIKQRFAQLSKEDPDKYFLQGQTQQPASPEQRPQMDPSQIQQQLAPPPTQTPSINTLANS